MRKILTLCLTTFVFLTSNIFANIDEKFSKFDSSVFNPIEFGLKDLSFEAEIDGLAKKLNEKQSYGKIENIYYKIYWHHKLGLLIDIHGLPRGFKELKAGLIQLISNRMDFIIPEKFEGKFKGYKFKYLSDSGKTIMGKDESNRKDISEVYVTFDDRGLLKKLKTLSPVGVRDSKFNFEKYSWSKNKYALSKLNLTIYEGIQVTELEYKLDYENQNGLGFLEELTLITKRSMRGSKEDPVVNESEIKFRKFEINKGIAEAKLAPMVKKEKKN